MVTISVRNRKTGQFNEGDFETLKSIDWSIFPFKAVAQPITSKQWPCRSGGKVFGPWIRNHSRAPLRLSGAEVGVQASRTGAHSLRSGGGYGHLAGWLRSRNRKKMGPLDIGLISRILSGRSPDFIDDREEYDSDAWKCIPIPIPR